MIRRVEYETGEYIMILIHTCHTMKKNTIYLPLNLFEKKIPGTYTINFGL